MAKRKSKQIIDGDDQDTKVTFYRAWCKRCGICTAFCPTKALELDEWGLSLCGEAGKVYHVPPVREAVSRFRNRRG